MGPADADDKAALDGFLEPVARWFRGTFEAPSPAQDLAWPVIRRGENTLLLAPTGSGKTLAAFLCAIDDLLHRAQEGELYDGIHVLYITPLKALGNDIHKNLREPLAGIRREAEGELPEIRVGVRTGDTPQSERARMVREPPHILITTPESLYLLLGSSRMVEALGSVRTVIVDEVHSLCDNKRGVHLAVSLERLQARMEGPLQRVGCSATLSPLEDIAAFLVGCDEQGRPRPCTIVNAGMRKGLDVQVMAPLPDFLEASNTALWSSAYELLLEEISRHTTTLIFCNSRYKTERTVLRMSELAETAESSREARPATGGARISAHHGSMSREIRLEVEDELKSNRLDALVATASLELGIDIGSVDLVYQLESPKSVATGLQRVGRAGHLLDATSKGRMLIFERDELMEAAAICRAMVAGEVDAVHMPRGCLDVLAQQIAGSVAAGDWQADELLALVRRAYPYTALTREEFDGVLGMLAGDHPFEMALPPRPVILWDRASGRLSATRSTKQVSSMNVGTIPETSEYEVVIDSSNRRVGTVHSEFVDDTLRIGDVFVLGSSCWRVAGVRRNRLLVEEAPGSTPTVPWWHGPVQPRTVEAGMRVGLLRREIAARLDDPEVESWLQKEYHLDAHGATALVDYVREQRAASGLVPDHERLLVETWKDELGRLNVIVHSPYGERINSTWGAAVATAARREFRQDWSVTASNDVLILSRADTEAPPLHEVGARELLAAVTRETLADLVRENAHSSVSFSSTFRDAATCSLQVLRAWQGERVPFWLQQYRAQELYEAAGAEQEYPVVAEVLRGYLHDSLDLPGLEQLLRHIESEQVQVVFQEVEAPSPFAHLLLVQEHYQDDHRMGRDRRAHLLRLHRQVLREVLTAEQMAELLDRRAIERLELRLLLRSETARAASSDELAQVIRDLGDVPATVEAVEQVGEGDAAEMLRALVEQARIVAVRLPDCEEEPVRLVAADLWREYHDAFGLGRPGRKLTAVLPRIENGEIVDFEEAGAAELIPARWRKKRPQHAARRAIVERYLARRGPVTQYEIMNHTGWPISVVEGILEELVASGKAARGVYTSDKPRPQWVNNANLEEIHRLTMGYLRRELAACAPYEVVDFVTRWQHLHPATRLEGPEGLREVIRQLQGVEVIQGALETEVLPGRVADYRPEMLDRLVASGEVRWRRVSTQEVRRGRIALCLRKDMEWLARGDGLQFEAAEEADADIADEILAVREYFREAGTAFFDDVLEATGVEEGAAMRAVWYLAWCGELTCDTYESIRHADFQATLSACYDLMNTPRKILSGKDTHERVIERMRGRRLDPRLGRWSATERLVPPRQPLPEAGMVGRWAGQLLDRWGIVSRDILASEVAAPPWSALVREFKRLELLGKVSRGYFIESHQGEQYGLPEAIELLRDCRARRSDGQELGYLADEPIFALSAHDPANLYATCLDMVDDAGSRVPRPRNLRLGSARVVVQAGQALLLARGQQLARLTRAQLARCIEQLKYDRAGHEVATELGRWNGHPMDVSPAAGLLWEQGFRLDGKGRMRWPPPAKPGPAVAVPNLQVFHPYYSEPPPVEYGLEWTVSRAPERVRPALRRVLETAVVETERDGWEVSWDADGFEADYRETARVRVAARRRWADLGIRTPRFRGEGSVHRFERRMRVEAPEEVNEAFVAELRGALDAAQELVDRFVPRAEEEG